MDDARYSHRQSNLVFPAITIAIFGVVIGLNLAYGERESAWLLIGIGVFVVAVSM